MSTDWRFCFPFVHCWGECVFSLGLPWLSWYNTVLVARHLHPLKIILCHLLKIWALNRKFDFYRSNYVGFASPLAVLPCRNHANRALNLTLPHSNRGVNDYSYLKENQRYSVYSFLNNLFSISCVFENTQYLNQIVSLDTFSLNLWDQCILHSLSLSANINDGRISIMTATFVSISFEQGNLFLSCPLLPLHPPAATQLMFIQARTGY